MEDALEAKVNYLLLERELIHRINETVKEEIMRLQAEILKHVGPECGGIRNAIKYISATDLTSLKDQVPAHRHQSKTEEKKETKSKQVEFSTLSKPPSATPSNRSR